MKKWLQISAAAGISIAVNASAELNYQRQDLGSEYYCDYLGNSYPATVDLDGSGRLVQHVQHDIRALYVDSDGYSFTNEYKVERFISCSVYTPSGEMIEAMDDFYQLGRDGGNAVTADDTYVYCGFIVEGRDDDRKTNANGLPRQPEPDETWYVVRRYNRDDGTVAGFPNGYGVDEGMLVINVNHMTAGEHVSGLAVYDGDLFVSDPYENKVKVYDTSNLSQTPFREISFVSGGRPGQMAIDSDKKLWVVDASNLEVCRYTRTGSHWNNHDVQLPSGCVPAGIAIDASGSSDRLLVCDKGDARNIKVYSSLGNSEVRESDFGAVGGIYSGTPGQVGTKKFHTPIGVGVDSSGNIYVAQIQGGNNGAVIESYTSWGSLRWKRMALPFTDAACLDPDDETKIYTPEEIFSYDYNASVGSGWSYDALTIKEGDSGRDGTVRVLNISGKKLLFNISNSGFTLDVFKFLSGSKEVEKVFTLEPSNAKGFDIDPDGTIWVARSNSWIRKYDFDGYDGSGNPSWSQLDSWSVPSPFNKVHRIMYDEDKDDMYLVGYTSNYPYQTTASGENIWKKAGKWIAKYSNWSGGNRNADWGIEAPWDDYADREQCQSTDIAGDYLFAVVGSKGKDFKSDDDPTDQPIIFIFKKQDGSYVGSIQPDENVGSHAMVDISHSINAYKRSNGEYIILCEDCAFSRMLIYRWTPGGAAVSQSPYGGSAAAIPGKIEAEDYDTGGEGVAYHDTSSGNSGGEYRSEDVDVQTCSEGGYNVGWTASGEWLEYTVDCTAGTYDIILSAASPNSGKSLTVKLGDGPEGTNFSTLGTVTVPDTDGWQNWQTAVLYGVEIPSGSKVLSLEINGGGFNIDWIQFVSITTESVMLNSGGDAVNGWTGDTGDIGGNTYSTSQSIDRSGLSSPAPEAVYQAERFGDFGYTFSDLIPNSSYIVRIHLAEIYFNASGKRQAASGKWMFMSTIHRC